jgi:hypothetical protein
MKRLTIGVFAILTAALIAGPAVAQAQGTFNVPFKFKAAGKNLQAGEYGVGRGGEGKIILRQVSTGKELEVLFTEKLAPPEPPVAEPRLVFDEVGDFAPSYTEYFTVYLLSEVWLPGEGGFQVHVTKGAHKNKTVTGTPVKVPPPGELSRPGQ